MVNGHEREEEQEEEGEEEEGATNSSPVRSDLTGGEDGCSSPGVSRPAENEEAPLEGVPFDEGQEPTVPVTRYYLRLCFRHLPTKSDVSTSAYFLRVEDQRLDENDVEGGVEYGALPGGPSLHSLELVLSQVFLPLVQGAAKQASASRLGAEELSGKKEELANTIRKFAGQVSQTLQQLSGDWRLSLPNVDVESVLAEELARDEDTVKRLEGFVDGWSDLINSAVSKENEKEPQGSGPLEEIDFWRERTAVLNGLYEQLNMPKVQKTVEVLEESTGRANQVQRFRAQHNELSRLYLEAKDNVKFLNTLERHFKSIRNGSLNAMLDTMPPMFNALRMVWIISRNYSDDTRMGNLLERIAYELRERVASKIRVNHLFDPQSLDPEREAIPKLNDAQAVLDAWEREYTRTRHIIEESGRDARWEFDSKRLFERTNYMSSICKDLREMVHVMSDFQKFLGPELKSVTGDNQGVENVLGRVRQMVRPLQDLEFDVFDQQHSDQWAAVRDKFKADRDQIEKAMRAFIDTSFKKLRSAEGAFELLQNFKGIKGEGAITKQMLDKFDEILSQFKREIEFIRDLFEQQRDNPPATKNQPPVAGAINWSRSLFSRVRKTMNRISEAWSEELKTEGGQEVKNMYLDFARSVMRFENEWFNQWKTNVDQTVAYYLQHPVLAKDAINGEIYVNFHPELNKLIRETRYLDRMGFNPSIPQAALNVTLQERKYHESVEGLRGMLERYRQVTRSLQPIEQSLLAPKLEELANALEPGFSPLNWNSLAITGFIDQTNRKIKDFQGLVEKIQKKSNNVQTVVNSIRGAQIVIDPAENEDLRRQMESEGQLMELSEFFEYVEQHRQGVVEDLRRKYHNITPLLKNVEAALLDTETGKAPQLREYYTYWEQQVFQALTQMVTKGLEKLLKMMQERTKSNQEDGKPSLFRLDAQLNGPEVVISVSLFVVVVVVVVVVGCFKLQRCRAAVRSRSGRKIITAV